MSDQNGSTHIDSVGTYVRVLVALLVATGVTTAVSRVDLGPFSTLVALGIACGKMLLVALFFMHLSHEKKWIYGSLILTVIGFAILMLVPSLTIGDSIGTPIHVEAPAAEHTGH